ncbi:hypothetical protein AVEN_109834-1 [Araneus ventricosus]|uniref:Uncharacterized protein n=1 Tax=Araneus ventricosus TaxID=182803 RepID=A0A4Y2SNT4_ARAVE|nr:hypothetical protein AVEN_109834-1 [Araneus ventricosus]
MTSPIFGAMSTSRRRERRLPAVQLRKSCSLRRAATLSVEMSRHPRSLFTFRTPLYKLSTFQELEATHPSIIVRKPEMEKEAHSKL